MLFLRSPAGDDVGGDIRRLQIRVGLCQVVDDAILDRGFERGEWRVVAGLTKPGHRRLGEILIIRPDRRRDVDKLDLRRDAAGGAERVYQPEKAARLAGAEIVDAAVLALPPQPQHRRDAILDIDEVAALLAIPVIGAMRSEQLDGLAGRDLAVILDDEAHHLALVVLVGPEHVEEFEPDPARWGEPGLRLAHRPGSAGGLRPAIEVEWPQPLEGVEAAGIVEPGRAVAVGRRRGGVDQRLAGGGAPGAQRG